MVALAALLHGSGEQQHATVDDGYDVVVKIDGHRGTAHGTYGGGYLEEHAKANVGDALLDIG